MHIRIQISIILTLLLTSRAFAAEPSFEREIWPLLEQTCHGCHSAADKKSKGGLSLDSAAHLMKGGDTGVVIVPGKPDESLLVKMISGDKPEMPKKQPPLPADQVKLLRDWIAAGAKIDTWPGEGKLKVVIPPAYRTPPAISAVALSPDGKRLAAAGRSEVFLVDTDDPETSPQRLATESDLITHVEFSPDGKQLAVAGGAPARYGEVRFFNPDDGKLVSMRRLTHDTLFRGNFAPDGKTIALGGADGAVHLVPMDPAAPERALELHSDWVMDVAYSPDGTMLVSGGRDKATKISSVQTGKLILTADLAPKDPVTAVASDPLFAISVTRRGDLLSFEYRIALTGIEVGGSGNGAVPVDKRNQYTRAFETQGENVYALATSGDRKLLAVAAPNSMGSEIRIYRIADRTRIMTIQNGPPKVLALSLDGKGSRLALGTKGGMVFVYDLPEGKNMGRLVRSFTAGPIQIASN